MIIERGINPNCSEAIIRFRVDKLTEEENEKLFKALKSYVDKYDYETNIYDNTIFGIHCITVDGNAPYNDSDGLKKIVNKFSFKNKIEIEEEEK